MPDAELGRLVDPRTGIVRRVRIVRPLQRYPRVWLAFARATEARRLGALSEPRSGGGIGLTREHAVGAALGEVVERYCGAFPPAGMLSGSRTELAARAVVPAPDVLNNMHGPAAPGFSPSTDTGHARWCQGWLAATGAPALAPWSLVCLGATAASRGAEDEDYPGPSISTGLACGPSPEVAALRGILECCERDAVMLAWYTRQVRGRATRPLVRAAWPTLAAEVERCHLDAQLFDVTADTEVPVAVAVLTPAGSRERAAFGMGAGLTLREAMERAFLEGLATWMWADSSLEQGEPIVRPDAGLDPSDFESRVMAYGTGLMAAELEELFVALDAAPDLGALPDAVPLPDHPRDLAALIEARGHSGLLFDITTPDVRDAGFSVVRALFPTLQPMEAVHAFRCPTEARLARFGSAQRWTSVPHPFP